MVRHDAEAEKRIPFLSILTIIGAVVCQSLVLAGNLHTVNNLRRLGHSSSGWATTGMNLADSFGDFSASLFSISKTMARVIDDILLVEETLDLLILNISGDLSKMSTRAGRGIDAVPWSNPDTDSFIQVNLAVSSDALAAGKAPQPWGQLPPTLGGTPPPWQGDQGPCGRVLQRAEPHLKDLRPKMHNLLQRLAPALKQIHRWLVTLSKRVQSYVGHFGVTIGRAQEIFDVVTDNFAAALTSDQDMIDQTYSLFDTSNTGLVSMWDLGNVSLMYGISFLQGERAQSLFEMYDINGDQLLDKQEFGSMMLDPSTPAMMATVLRAYANRLAEVAGPLKRAETRVEVARAVASYLQTVVAKNMTKVGWMAQALTNGSLPTNFTVAVLHQLALAAEDPNKMTTVETGSVIVRRMVDMKPEAVRQALELMVDPDVWASEGLDPELQAPVIERTAKWAADAGISSGVSVCATLVGDAHVDLHELTDSSFSGRARQLQQETAALPELYRWRAERGQRSHAAARREKLARRADQLMGSASSRQLLEELLGTVLPASTQVSPQATRAVHKGREAAPEVLQFAKWLANNASRNAAMLSSRCFDYNARMSHHVQGLTSKIRGAADKVFSALQFVSKYTSENEIDELIADFEAFQARAPQELLEICNRVTEDNTHRINLPAEGVWAKIFGILRATENALPNVIDGLEAAQMTCASVSNSMSSVFEVLIDKLPLSFSLSAAWWRNFWITYYILFLLVDFIMLAWILWVSGTLDRLFLRGPSGPEDGSQKKTGEAEPADDYEPPRTFAEKLQVCMRGCNACFQSRLVDRTLLFWSVLLLIELCVFVSFIFTLLLSVLAMVKMFIHSGCNQLYMLGDTTICAEVMVNVKFWLTSFLNSDFLTPLTVCDRRLLLTCDLISHDLMKSSVFTVVGGFIGSFLVFQVIVESAILHERVRWRMALSAPRTEL